MKFIYLSKKVETSIEALKKTGRAGKMIRVVAKKPAKMISKTNEGNDIVADDHGLFKQYTEGSASCFLGVGPRI